MENRVLSSYNSLQARLEKRFTEGFSSLFSYTWGKALTEAPDHISTSGGGAGLDTGTFREPQNPDNLKAERGLAEFDVKHRFVASYIYELPCGRNRRWGQNWNSFTDLFLGGWQVNGIHSFQGGLGLTATLGGGSVLNIGGERRARPNRVPGQVAELPSDQQTVAMWFNKAAFTTAFSPSPQAFGNSGVGIMRGPGYGSVDLTLAKSIHLDEKRFFQFRTEFFNAFNRANFDPPDIRAEAGGFGTILSSRNARIIQFALKFYY
jgi:hypothetical protein